MKIAILAAGFSSRLGQDKVLARVHGRTLLQRTLEVVASLPHAGILIVLPERCATQRRFGNSPHVLRIPNPRRASGLASSVRVAMRRAGYASALLLLPVDLVQLEPRDLLRLVRRWCATPARVVASDSAEFGGVPLILPRRYFTLAGSLEGDRGLRAVLSSLPRGAVVRVAAPSARVDVDTPADLAAARRQWRRGEKSRSASST